MDESLKSWLSKGMYLPKFLRDFHDQKDVFKWIWRRIETRMAADPSTKTYLGSMNWVASQILVIDHFLWWMAVHGYTLQPTRAKYEFADWSESVSQMKVEEAEAFRAMLAKEPPIDK